MKKLISPTGCKVISIALVSILLMPFFLFFTGGIAEAAGGSLFPENTGIFKGILMIVLAFLVERVLGNQQVSATPGDPAITLPDTSDNYYNPPGKYLAKGEKEVLGFYVNWETVGSESHPSLIRNGENIDLVAPYWYTVTATGNIKNQLEGHRPEVKNFTRQNGQLIMPLINNEKTSSTMLTDPKIRTKAVNNIVSLVQRNNYDGVNIDFEFIPTWSKDGYTEFIRQLSRKLKARGKMVTISVFPKIDVPHELTAAYDYKALEPYIDRMVIMTYDNHWSTGPAGPVAPIKWVEENIQYALKSIPREKLLLGIANYGYDWSAPGKGKDIAAKKAIELAKRKNARILWNMEAQVPYFYYYDSSHTKHEVWFENSYSLDMKLNLVNKYNLQGIAIWRLGNEEDRFWEIVKDRLNK